MLYVSDDDNNNRILFYFILFCLRKIFIEIENVLMKMNKSTKKDFVRLDFLFLFSFYVHFHDFIFSLVTIGDSFGNCSVGIWDDMIPFHVTPQGRASVIVTGYSEKIDLTESLKSPNISIKKVLKALDQQ